MGPRGWLNGLLVSVAIVSATGCAGSADGRSGESAEAGCTVNMVTDYVPVDGVALETPERALAQWVAMARADLTRSITSYEGAEASSTGATGDRARLEAIEGVASVLESHAVTVEEGTSPRKAKLVGHNATGMSFDITLTGGATKDPPVWMVTGYSMELADYRCPEVPGSTK